MSHGQDSDEGGTPLVTNRTMEIVVALLLLSVSAIVLFDTTRLGFGWVAGEGPAPGYFPFYMGLMVAVSALAILLRAVMGKAADANETFVTLPQFMRVLAVLIPLAGFILLIEFVGIYLASAVFIALFMVAVGREGVLKALVIAVAIPVVLFLMFEKWFLVPLPKGPLEAVLGLG